MSALEAFANSIGIRNFEQFEHSECFECPESKLIFFKTRLKTLQSNVSRLTIKDSQELSRILKNSREFSRNLENSREFSRIFKNS